MGLPPMPGTQSDQSATSGTSAAPQSRVRILAEIAVMVSLATVLNTIKIFTFPEGGSVTLGAMVPLLFLALRRGVKVGMLAGATFGIIDLYFEYFVYNPVQFLLDYPLAFGALGLAGLFSGRIAGSSRQAGKPGSAVWSIVGVAVGIGGRFVCHFLSGLIFFASYAPAGESPALYSAIYNASYLLPELAISASVILVLSERGVIKAGM